MILYYYDKPVILVEEIKQFYIAKIRFECGYETYVDSRLLSFKNIKNNNIIVEI